MTPVPTLNRDALTKALNGDRRLVQAFEQQALAVGEAQDAVTVQADATEALQDATVLTLSPNATLTNERVLKLGDGVRAADDGTYLTLYVDDRFAHVAGGFRVDLTAQGDTAVVLPLGGMLATTDGDETLTNKTLVAPVVSGIATYANDAAAAAGGIPVGGIYRTATGLIDRQA